MYNYGQHTASKDHTKKTMFLTLSQSPLSYYIDQIMLYSEYIPSLHTSQDLITVSIIIQYLCKIIHKSK